MRQWLLLAAIVLLSACASAPKPKPRVYADSDRPRDVAAPVAAGIPAACIQTREHRDSDYTRGGLYAPGVSDSAPTARLDISDLQEPEPRAEPRSLYGNKSPYSVLGKSYRVRDEARGYRERGIASWYGQKFHGRMTSSREIYDMCSFSAAHKTLPLPSFARVTNLDNGTSVIVRVNDRGPFHEGRIIDLSYAAAIKLGVDRTGTARVEVVALSGGEDADDNDANYYAAKNNTPPATTEQFSPASDGANFGKRDGKRIVQVASFGEKENAERARERLRDAGIRNVDLDRVRVSGRRLWRVRIGPLAHDAALAVLDQVRALGYPGPRIFTE